MVEGSPDLIAQLLDKLMDNATDFRSAAGPSRSCSKARTHDLPPQRAQ